MRGRRRSAGLYGPIAAPHPRPLCRASRQSPNRVDLPSGVSALLTPFQSKYPIRKWPVKDNCLSYRSFASVSVWRMPPAGPVRRETGAPQNRTWPVPANVKQSGAPSRLVHAVARNRVIGQDVAPRRLGPGRRKTMESAGTNGGHGSGEWGQRWRSSVADT